MVYKHVLRRYAKQRFARVLFIFGEEDVNRIKAKYFRDGITDTELDAVEWKFWKSLIKKGELHRYIPFDKRNACADEFDKIYEELKRLGESDAYHGIPLWKKGADALHKRQVNLLREGFISDPEGVPMYSERPPVGKSQKKVKDYCARGTGANEASHGHEVAETTSAGTQGVMLAHRKLCYLTVVDNVKSEIRNSGTMPDLGHFDLWIVEDNKQYIENLGWTGTAKDPFQKYKVFDDEPTEMMGAYALSASLEMDSSERQKPSGNVPLSAPSEPLPASPPRSQPEMPVASEQGALPLEEHSWDSWASDMSAFMHQLSPSRASAQPGQLSPSKQNTTQTPSCSLAATSSPVRHHPPSLSPLAVMAGVSLAASAGPAAAILGLPSPRQGPLAAPVSNQSSFPVSTASASSTSSIALPPHPAVSESVQRSNPTGGAAPQFPRVSARGRNVLSQTARAHSAWLDYAPIDTRNYMEVDLASRLLSAPDVIVIADPNKRLEMATDKWTFMFQNRHNTAGNWAPSHDITVSFLRDFSTWIYARHQEIIAQMHFDSSVS
jgi:hypothetical protein